jgi:alkaline phosphatase D
MSGMGAAALALGTQGLWLPRTGLAQPTPPSSSAGYFKLGVASGEPLYDSTSGASVVLWTRLTPGDPLNGGGMPAGQGDVEVDLKVGKFYPENPDSEKFGPAEVDRKVTAEATYAHSVHEEVTGLDAGAHYWYQFKLPVADPYKGEVSTVGHTKTAPASDASPSSMTFALASCQHWESGHYTAYGHMANQELDLVVHVGDYIYEGAPSQGKIPRVKPDRSGYDYHSAVVDPSWGCNTLADYRNRHAQYKTDRHLQAAHAKHPWVVVWDDHEVENDYVGTNSWYRQSDFANRRAAAYQAYYEHMPLRWRTRGEQTLTLNDSKQVTNIELYRQISYGKLAQFCVLDTRQFRSYWACANQGALIEDNCTERTQDPIINKRKPYRRHTYLGGKEMGLYNEQNPWLKDSQEKWLKDALTSSNSRWNVLAQQVIMFKYDHNDWSGDYYSEAWDSYSATRDRILKHIVEKKVRNPVVLSGDMHSSWASNLESNFNDTSTSDIIGAEFTTTSITSGLSSGWKTTYQNALSANKHVKHYDGSQGGYLRCTLDNTRWTAEYIKAASLTDNNNTNAAVSKTLYVDAKDSGSSGLNP